jgi:GNAT superfamily N-acetyltransferase
MTRSTFDPEAGAEGSTATPTESSAARQREGRSARDLAAILSIRAERADAQASLDLVHRYLHELHERLGIEICCGDVVAEAAAYHPPSGSFVVVRQEGVPVGCGAVRAIGGDVGEMKRMWVAPGIRRQGVGARLLDTLEDEARRIGYRLVRLDTRRELVEAVSLYRRAGYREVPAYNDNADADLWFEKRL